MPTKEHEECYRRGETTRNRVGTEVAHCKADYSLSSNALFADTTDASVIPLMI